MKLEIVSHCWHYSRPLVYQLSSLWLYPPEQVQVTMTVFYTETDVNTAVALRYFLAAKTPESVTLRGWALEDGFVTRRMVGRNLAALSTEADWVWFTDCDYVFRKGCLEGFAKLDAKRVSPLCFPAYGYISRTHQDGDEELGRVPDAPKVLNIEADRYIRRRHFRAIGGIQIVPGDVARRVGYCAESRWHEVPSASWAPNRDDVWFRRSLGGAGIPVRLPSVYRMRHSTRGGPLLDGPAMHSPEVVTG